MGKRFAYMLLGACIGLLVIEAAGFLRYHRFGFNMTVAGVALGAAGLAASIAERKGKIKSIQELERPLTLFPPR